MKDEGGRKTSLFFLIALYCLPPVLLLAIGWGLFGMTGRDDAHISYWPAYTLARFGEILNYNGERVEQSSSLLQVLLIALAGRLLPIDFVTLGRLSAIAGGVAALFATAYAAALADRRIAFGAALLTSVSAYFVYWTFGGLEGPLMALTALLMVAALSRFLSAAAVTGGALLWSLLTMLLFLLVRPETLIVLPAMLAGCAAILLLKLPFATGPGRLWAKSRLSRLAVLLAGALILTALIELGRWWYFGSLFPQPVFAKMRGLNLPVFQAGWGYLSRAIYSTRLVQALTLSLCAAIVYTAWRQLRARELNFALTLSLLFLASYTLFVVLSGGDWMEAGRFIAPLAPFAAIVTVWALTEIVKRPLLAGFGVSALMGVHLLAIHEQALSQSTGQPVWSRPVFSSQIDTSPFSPLELINRANLRDIPMSRALDAIVTRLLAYRRARLTIVSGQMGLAVYHLAQRHFGQFRVIDAFGLVERSLTQCAALRSLEKSPAGLDFRYADHLRNWTPLVECGIARPDLIFNIDAPPRQLAQHGYTVVYLQEGPVFTPTRLPGLVVSGDEYIAVRNDWLAALEGFAVVRVGFGEMLRE